MRRESPGCARLSINLLGDKTTTSAAHARFPGSAAPDRGHPERYVNFFVFSEKAWLIQQCRVRGEGNFGQWATEGVQRVRQLMYGLLRFSSILCLPKYILMLFGPGSEKTGHALL